MEGVKAAPLKGRDKTDILDNRHSRGHFRLQKAGAQETKSCGDLRILSLLRSRVALFVIDEMATQSSKCAMHVVALPYPAQGHLLPVIYLATKLAAAGISVTLINPDSIHKNLSSQWQCPVGMDIRLVQVSCDLNIPNGVDAKILGETSLLLDAVEKMRVPVEQLIGTIQPPPCCVISDYFLRWGVEVTRKLNLKVVTYWPGNAAWSSIHHHTNMLISRGDACKGHLDYNKSICYVPGLDTFQLQHLPSYYKRELDGPLLDFFSSSADRMKDADWILVNSISDIEPYTFGAMQQVLMNRNFVGVGPLLPTPDFQVSLRAEEHECLEWLDRQAPQSVLYIAFGSLCILPEDQIRELAAGLEASRHPFIWVDITGALSSSETIRSRVQGIVVSWAPQLQVLAHSSTAAFLSHCGWNSILESIYHGVPLLGWPCHSEQSMNCKLVEDWKIGRRFSDGHNVERGEVERIIRDFMEADRRMGEFRGRITALQDKVRSSANRGGTSHANFERFVRELMTSVTCLK